MSTLPALKWCAEDPPRQPRLSKPVALVVEGSAAVRATTVRLLERFGFVVLSAGTVAEARNRMDGLYGPLDLLVAEVALPDGSGGRLARDLRERDPGLPVLFVSCDRHSDAADRSDDLGAPVLERADDVNLLAREVRSLLRV